MLAPSRSTLFCSPMAHLFRRSPAFDVRGCAALLVSLAGVACTPEKAPADPPSDTGGSEDGSDVVVADYALTLKPVLPPNQPDLFAIAAEVQLEISQGGEVLGPFSLAELAAGGGQLAEALPALDGAVLTLRALDADGNLVSVGRSAPVTAQTGPQEVSIFMGRSRSVGWLDPVPSATGSERPVHAGGLVALGGGVFQLYGGTLRVSTTGSSPGEDADDGIWQLDLNDVNGGLLFSRVADMVSTGTGSGGGARAAHTVTRLVGDHPDAGLLLIAGGATDYFDSPNATRQAAIYDPVALAVVAELEMGSPLFQHIATVDANDRVVLSGGGTSRSDTSVNQIAGNTRIYIYEPTAREFESIGVSDEPYLFHGAAARRDGSVLLCGGAPFDAPGDAYDAEDYAGSGCGVLTVSGEYVPRSASGIQLPVPMIHPAMLTLSDGSVVLAGGLSPAETDGDVSYFAESRVWSLAPGASDWTVVGTLGLGRGLATVVEVGADEVLVVGGVTRLEQPGFPDGELAVSCVERLNVRTGVSRFVPASVLSVADEAGYTCGPTQVDAGLRSAASSVMVALDPSDTSVLMVGGLSDGPPANSGVSLYFPDR